MTSPLLSQNPFAQAETLYACTFTATTLDDHLLEMVNELPEVLSLSADILSGKPSITVFTTESQQAIWQSHLAALALAGKWQLELCSLTEVESCDWVAETQKQIKPQHIGNFTILGAHHEVAEVITRRHIIWLDAGAAFGTGEHGTTTGCLHAIHNVNRDTLIRNALDMGCGTAILGIAQAKAAPCRVLAVDNDPVAVKVAEENGKRNRVATQMRCLVSQGFRHPLIAQSAPYDLIIANILARPVRDMAHHIAAHLSPQGKVILSGFYERNLRYVLNRYQAIGLSLHCHYVYNGWLTLVLRK